MHIFAQNTALQMYIVLHWGFNKAVGSLMNNFVRLHFRFKLLNPALKDYHKDQGYNTIRKLTCFEAVWVKD